jgi:hypothetical protein
MAVAVQSQLDLDVAVEALRRRRGTTAVPELVSELRKKGLSEGDAREMIWRLLALGVLEFTADMTLRISRSPASRGVR